MLETDDMKRLAIFLLLLLAVLATTARGDLRLEAGQTTPVTLRIANHNDDPIRNLRLQVTTGAAWLEVKMPEGLEGEKHGDITTYTIKQVTQGKDSALELALQVTVHKTREPGKAEDGEGKDKKKATEEDSTIGRFARIHFKLWKADENPGKEKKGAKGSADSLGVPSWRSWEAEYAVESTYKELAKKPSDLEWHLVDARRGSTGNQITLTVRNKSEFKPLLNVTVIPVSPPGPVTIGKASAEDKIVINNVQGMKVIEKEDEGEFKVTFSVSGDAKPGQTDAVYLYVRTSTLGASPNPWDPILMVSVAARHSGLPGNFEAYVYYNLPPKTAKDKPKGVDESTWLPVPKGTKISVSQIYMQRGPGGTEKPVEQFIGYGNVIDERGYLICTVRPERQRLMRFRIVADTIASVLEVVYKDEKKEEIEKLTVKGARAAVTPLGLRGGREKRPWRNISREFLVEEEKAASILEETDTGNRDHAARAAAKQRKFYRAKAGQEGKFVVGRKILIPYSEYGVHVGTSKDKGILIKWEGELSTGGHINSLWDNPTIFNSGGAMGGAMTLADQTKAAFMPGGYRAEYAQELMIAGGSPGIFYRNFNELHHILAALIRAQDFCATLRYFSSDAAPKPAVPGGEAKEAKPRGVPRLPGVIASWRKGGHVEGGETGYVRRKDGTWRLIVQGLAEDPDERDIGLVLRGYGAAIRRRFWKPDRQATDDENEPPNYRYRERTSPREAWAHGFDIFFAAAVLNRPQVLNERAVQAKDRENRSVDLNTIHADARMAQGKAIYRAKFRRLRGADNAVAVAAGLWRAAQILSRERLIDAILFAEGGDILWFLNLVRLESPDLLRDMAALGLCPTVDRWPPAASASESVSPEAVRLIWDPNDMLSGGKLEASLIYSTEGSEKTARVALKGSKSGREPIIHPFNELRDNKEGEGQIAVALRNGQKVYWTVETTLKGRGEKMGFKWPLQDFTAALPSSRIGPRGRSLYANSRSRIRPAADSTDHPVGFDNATIHSVLGGRKVLGGAVYKVRIEAPDPASKAAREFKKPVELTLSWKEDEDPGDATPGVFFRNPETSRWELVGNKRVGERDVQAMITRAGSYALMVDRLPPQVEGLLDVPDPFPVGVEGIAWTLSGRLSEPATLTLQIEDKAGKVVRTLLKDAAKDVGQLEVTWDGKDDAGKTVADGTYTYRLLARDASKLKAKPVTGTVTVLSGDMGSATGKVTVAGESQGAPIVTLVGASLRAECEADGSFWLLGLPPGPYTFQFSARGHFEEERRGELKTKGGEIAIPPVALTHVALKDLKASSEVFTPDGDGEADYVSVSFTMTRGCPLDAGVYDADGQLVSALQVGTVRQAHGGLSPSKAKAMAKGEAVLLWQGLDDEETPQPSGWYTIRLIAHARREGIPQGDLKVLLDRGLVHKANAFPHTFSPNGDGLDDELEIGYILDDDALVTVRLLRPDGTLLKELLTDEKQRQGWSIVGWDGKGPDGKVIGDGRYRYEIRPKYSTGHASKVAAGEFMADSQPPEIGEVEPFNGATLDTGTPTIRAKVLSDRTDLDPTRLQIKIDENTVAADGYDEKTGVFTFTPKTSLGEGVHIAIAYAQDWAGNYAPPQAVSFKIDLSKDGTVRQAHGALSLPKGKKFVDRTKPTVVDPLPAKGTTVYTATPLIFARVRDAESGIDPNNIAIFFNGEKVANTVRSYIPGKSGKPWDWYFYEKAIILFDPLQGEVRYVPLEKLKSGRNHVEVEVLDRQGNKSARAETVFDVVIDNDKPTVAKLSPANGATLAKPEAILSAILGDEGKSGLDMDTLRLRLDGREIALDAAAYTFDKATGALSIPLKAPLARDAQHAVLLTVRDRAGNLSNAASSIFNVVEDGELPRIDLISQKPALPKGQALLLAAAVYDLGRSGIDPATVVLTLDGKAIPSDNPQTAVPEGYRLTRGLLTHTLEGLAPGRHVISLGVRDRAGNAAQDAVWQFEVK